MHATGRERGAVLELVLAVRLLPSEDEPLRVDHRHPAHQAAARAVPVPLLSLQEEALPCGQVAELWVLLVDRPLQPVITQRAVTPRPAGLNI